MRDIPAVAWILGVFMAAGVVIMIYARSGGEALPPYQNVWEHIEGLQQNIQSRRFKLNPEEQQELEIPPYRFTARRLADQRRPVPAAVYLLRIRPWGRRPLPDLWIGQEINVAMIDVKPHEVMGDVRLVSVRKLEKDQIENPPPSP